ncbi:ATP-dependent Clp protease protease subunit [Diaminobutyricimonas aerilata]|uniref:ATP-dependent Clp protease proteolytic subunit n=1 Tax=Diaminobutyricimonas aerilata TaxID=1162967 RepID=A0A2M9CN72_9MICO|nr:ATP-dependent Clp protease proteolytic subunit [Diaminobutyricimonas aerilata]PJJ73304.1 ATP-dependent Clp protease protease subunit [Diaminobutyricimonas aerilata]
MSSYTIPYVTERRGGVERTMDVYSRLLSERIVYLGTEIDDGVANALIAQLLHLESDSPDSPVNLYINSPGGSPSAMLAVYDTMRHIRPEVATTCVGQAAGPAAVLLAGGASGRRAVLEHARVILHQPSTQGQGTIPDLIIHAEEVVRVRSQLEGVLARHTGKDLATLRRDTDRDLILPAEAAVQYGLADAVLGEREPIGGSLAAGMLTGR